MLRELVAVVVQDGSAMVIKEKPSIATLLSERMLDTARTEQNQVLMQNPTVAQAPPELACRVVRVGSKLTVFPPHSPEGCRYRHMPPH